MKTRFTLSLLGLFLPLSIFAQEPAEAVAEEENYEEPAITFSSTRVVNGHSVETLEKGIASAISLV
jgi:hypothetical protein